MQLNYDLVIFDADGTLRRSTVSGQPCPHTSNEWELIAGVREHLAQFPWQKCGEKYTGRIKYGLATNQAGVAEGYLHRYTAMSLAIDLVHEAFDIVPADSSLIRICPHAPREKCACRKPKPGMLHDIITNSELESPRVLFVGDQVSDELAAACAGIDFQWAWDFFGRTRDEWIDVYARRA